MTGQDGRQQERARILDALFDGPQDREAKLRLRWAIGYRELVEIIEGRADQSLPQAPRDGLAGSDEAVEDAVDAAARTMYGVEPEALQPEDWQAAVATARAMVAAALPFIAARVRAEAVAEERQRIETLLQAEIGTYPETVGDGPQGWAMFSRKCGLRDALDLVRSAAGSVPVATPSAAECEHGRSGPHWYLPGPSSSRCPGPVATPAKMAERHVCSGTPCSTQHHAFYGQLCNVTNCVEDFCIGSQEPSVGTGTPARSDDQWGVGLGEAAEILGTSKQRVHQLSQTAAFPRALLRLRSGPVWSRAAVEAYAATRNRLPGRRPSSTEISGGSGHAERQDEIEAVMRAFVLRRNTDVSGVSGTGIVAEGVEFSSGVVALTWLSDWPTSVVFHDRGIESVEAIHGHNGATVIEFLPVGPDCGGDHGPDLSAQARLVAQFSESSELAKRVALEEENDRLTAEVARYRAAIEEADQQLDIAVAHAGSGYKKPTQELIERVAELVRAPLAALGDGE